MFLKTHFFENLHLEIPTSNKEDVEFLGRLMENGEFKPVIDRIYKLEEIVEAYKYVESAQKTGNVLIKI